MLEVVCWCCQNFNSKEYLEIELISGKLVNGICVLKNITCHSEDNVCEEFIIRKGLFIKRIIPSHCKFYKSDI